jgi:nitroreductase
MNVLDALRARQAVRAFRPNPVPYDTLVALLEAGKYAPSGGNLQPWHVYVLTGPAKDALITTAQAKLDRGEREQPKYEIYPKNLWEPLRARRRDAGVQRYEAFGHSRAVNGQLMLERANLGFFGAPAGLFFCLDQRVGPPQWADMGMFMQSLMLLAAEMGWLPARRKFGRTGPTPLAQR